MRPAELLDYAYWELHLIEDWIIRVVVANSRDTREQIFQTTPDQSQPFGNAQMIGDRQLGGLVNILSPLRGIRIGAAAKAGEEVELEMVVRVDEPRQNTVVAEIHVHSLLHCAMKIAGCAQAASNSRCLPAFANNSR